MPYQESCRRPKLQKKGIYEDIEEVHEDWIRKFVKTRPAKGPRRSMRNGLGRLNLHETMKTPSENLEEIPMTSSGAISITGVSSSNPKASKKSVKAKESNQGCSESEREALGEYNRDSDKTEEQIAAFLAGFRVKQDYILVSMRAQMERLEKLVDSLTSAATSISRAACDLVDSTTSSTAKLSAGVTNHLDKSARSKKQESTADIEKPKKNEAPESSSGSKIKLTLSELTTIMGVQISDLLNFYKITDETLNNVLSEFEGPLQAIKERPGGMLAIKGKIKKAIHDTKKQ